MKSLICACIVLHLMACSEDTTATGTTGPEVVPVSSADHPLDAATTADGATVFFVTDGASGSALFRATEGAPVRLATFTHATSLVVARDGATVYVGEAAGGVLAVPVAGGDPVQVPGTEGFSVAMLDLTDRLILAGADADGTPGVFVVAAAGGTPETVVTGLEAAPTGVLQLPEGDFAVALPAGRIVRAEGATGTTLYQGEALGTPPGMALSPDGQLMISSLSAEGTAQVVFLDLATGATSIFDDVIGANTGAGGLHKAAEAAVYAWADAIPPGRVYRIQF